MPQQRHHQVEPARRERATSPNHRPEAAVSAGRAAVQRAAADPSSASPRDFLALQRTVGNRAASRLLGGGQARPVIQAKLTVGPAGDAYEQEADRVAGEVMRMPTPAGDSLAVQPDEAEEQVRRKPLSETITPVVQRVEEEPDDRDEEAKDSLAQRAATSRDAGFEAGPDIERRLVANQARGKPLPADTRDFMETRFGADFGGVRVHTGDEASQLNRAMDAQAFTHGQDIYLDQGKYDPGTGAGKHLLAHELTHVVEQTGNANGQSAVARKRTPAGILQRYGKSTTSYTTTNTDVNVPHMFTSQSIDPVITANNQLRHETKNEVDPRLYFSDDHTIAINKAKKMEAKEFYATDAVINAANLALAAKGSAVQLNGNPNVVVNTPAHGNPLKMVTPGIKLTGAGPFNVGNQAHFGTSVCIDVAQKVMGNLAGARTTQAIFRPNPLAPEHVEDFTPGNVGASEVYKLADFVANSPTNAPTTGDMHTAMTTGGQVNASGKAYGRFASSKGRIARARALAINQFAKAEVGEGFATFSTRARGGSKKTWGYHYAGVVAKSTDGRDWVTLENYNRTGDITQLQQKLYTKLMKTNKAVVLNKINQLEQDLAQLDQRARDMDPRLLQLQDLKDKKNISRRLKEVIIAIDENGGGNRAQGEQEYNQVIATEPKSKWFFHLYGSSKGQSFHEQQAKSDYFSNPLTLAVRKQ